MKKFLFVALIAVTIVGCKKKDTIDAKDTDGTEVSSTAGTDVAVNADASYVWWKGSKLVGGSHEGKIPVQAGSFKVSDGNLTGGEFTLNVDGLTNTDLESGKGKEDLESHLKNADFFNTSEFPTASFKILGSKALENDANGNTHQVSGTLTIKSSSKVIDIPAKVSINGESVSFESTFNIDRTDFGVDYGSGTKITDLAKDKIINDAVELKVVATS